MKDDQFDAAIEFRLMPASIPLKYSSRNEDPFIVNDITLIGDEL